MTDVGRNDGNHGPASDAPARRVEPDVLLCAGVPRWCTCCFDDVTDGGAGVQVRIGWHDPVRLGTDLACDVAHRPDPGTRPDRWSADQCAAVHLPVPGPDARRTRGA